MKCGVLHVVGVSNISFTSCVPHFNGNLSIAVLVIIHKTIDTVCISLQKIQYNKHISRQHHKALMEPISNKTIGFCIVK